MVVHIKKQSMSCIAISKPSNLRCSQKWTAEYDKIPAGFMEN